MHLISHRGESRCRGGKNQSKEKRGKNFFITVPFGAPNSQLNDVPWCCIDKDYFTQMDSLAQ